MDLIKKRILLLSLVVCSCLTCYGQWDSRYKPLYKRMAYTGHFASCAESKYDSKGKMVDLFVGYRKGRFEVGSAALSIAGDNYALSNEKITELSDVCYFEYDASFRGTAYKVKVSIKKGRYNNKASIELYDPKLKVKYVHHCKKI